MHTKFIFVTGGVTSSLGKGIVASSLGCLLKSRGFKISIQKMDPYLNVDPGTMNPYQHGEVFVTDDGAETDLDLGHYERFIDQPLTASHSVSSGQIYWNLFERERKGEMNGTTIQVIPHVTGGIISKIEAAAKAADSDVMLVELGGTVGDIESEPFQEAIRQFRWSVGPENCIFIHVTLLPYLESSGELKTKPTQHSIRTLLSKGIQPDIVVCRSLKRVGREQREKISLLCNLEADHIMESPNASTLYEVPLLLHQQGLDELVCRMLGIKGREPELTAWRKMVENIKNPTQEVNIALVGKYVELHDAYLSIAESLTHGGAFHSAKVHIHWINADTVTDETANILKDMQGILVPGGFGTRGLEGKIRAIQYARENNVPFLGICLGMQMAVVEYARHVLNMYDANTTEANPSTPYPVIDLMPEQLNITQRGGTMRLGKYDCELVQGTKAQKAYGETMISERHRHRYEFNNEYRERFDASNMRVAGINPGRNLVEIVELTNHPWFVAVQFHPEFKSRPDRPHPLFRDFVGAAIERKKLLG
ncbi:CTP synthase [Gehongia tenuis]|uniref:CTP synthase n=1 Tax=Gehongia tenuis TaxID=2763655 RepID=A0A926HP47_9FIRM|nr:CTP synthase [Gehongia tenuis]MBC8531289.1 CTP synthase [Gehongia tenuis]